MQNVLALLRRELGASFDSPMAYFVVPTYVALVGGFALWFDDVFTAGVASPRGIFFWSGLFLVLLAPAVTMRLLAEERRTGSLELLASLPLRDEEIILGKFLAAVVLVGTALFATLPMVGMLAWLGTPEVAGDAAPRIVRAFTQTGLDGGPVATGYLGLLLAGSALCAVGLAASAWTSNQVIAFLVALVLSIFPWAAGYFVGRLPADLQPWVTMLTFQPHLDNLFKGVVDTRDLVYWAGVTAVFLHAAVYSLERRRWTA